MTELSDQFEELVIANHILATEGVVDAYGHVSVRHPDRSDRFILACSRSPELVKVDDLMVYELDGSPVVETERRHYSERFIHGAVFESRPDALAVVHNHSYEVIPFGVTGVPLRPLAHVAASIGPNVPVWDISEKFGECTNLLVVNMEQGRDLARRLGDNTVALMRGHGCVVCGPSLRQAVATAIFLQVNARLQLHAMGLAGPEEIKFLSDGEIESMVRHNSPKVLERAWEYWARRSGHQLEELK